MTLAHESAGSPAESLDRDSITGRLFRVTAAVAIAAAGVVTLGSIINHFAFDDAILDLDAGREASLNNWITVVAAFTAALAAALHALLFSARRRWFLVLTAVFAFISLDDLIALHERVGSRIGGENAEMAIFAPVWGAALLISWALARELPSRAGRFLRLGLILLVVGIVVDLGAGFTRDLDREGTAWPHATRIAVEEGFEVSGWVLVSGTLTILLCLGLLDAGHSSRLRGPPRG